MRIQLFANAVAVTLAVLLLGGCGGSQLTVEPITSTGNPGELVGQLDAEVSSGRQNQFNVLSPTLFAKAEQNLIDAKVSLQKGDKISYILDNVAKAKAQMKGAEKNVEVAKTALAKTIKAREEARAVGATIYEADYAQVEESFLDLTRAIEDDNLKWAKKNQDKVIDLYRALEVRAIKEKTLGEVRKTIDQAAKEGARKLAPELYAEANKELQAVDSFISKNPYKKAEMLKKADTALFNAQRLVEQTRLRKKLQSMSSSQVALWMEDMLGKITTSLTAPDMRNQSTQTQLDNIIGSINSMQSDRQFMGDQVKILQAEKVAKQQNEMRLASEKEAAEQRLAAERRFHKMYNEVQGFFRKEEAEVYKQGTQLVIRLRSIQFPVGKAIIMPSNYELLSKVQKAVRTFGEPTVVVEGHSDSTGSAATNEILSQQRADAVKEYLVANQTLPAANISAVGFGSVRPLASNATASGRAVNRRIDLIITPQTASM